MSQDDDEWVRRALASTRPDGSVPDDVVARLDARLDALHREAVLHDGTPLTRRRRVGPYVLAAAAVVAVVAVGFPVVRHLGDTNTATSSASSAGGEAAAPSASSSVPTPASPTGGDARLGLTAEGPQLRTTGFRAGAAASLPQLLEAAQAYELGGAETASSCRATPAAGTQGALVQVDGRPALAEISAPSDGQRVVRALSCADGSVLATASVPVS